MIVLARASSNLTTYQPNQADADTTETIDFELTDFDTAPVF
jgi:hypothetical protein